MDNKNMKIFSLSSNRPLAEKIAQTCGLKLGEATINRFSDGEIQIKIDESIRGEELQLLF
ncbi:ribose-phosphate pyrophosphokinase-like domain-containing protein [Apilactobacillus kunkeei]|uniref:ribose-phosphate pyrophosphokinase-like domain-containing protein n=1 Tax=Apilactobacillus kunkeei TaxID=148814 RepID=UPI001CDC38AB|nr:ribose-phosphate pyrophosphokinase-like domain-containing protein [Apilactobacillus kunkeei]